MVLYWSEFYHSKILYIEDFRYSVLLTKIAVCFFV